MKKIYILISVVMLGLTSCGDETPVETLNKRAIYSSINKVDKNSQNAFLIDIDKNSHRMQHIKNWTDGTKKFFATRKFESQCKWMKTHQSVRGKNGTELFLPYFKNKGFSKRDMLLLASQSVPASSACSKEGRKNSTYKGSSPTTWSNQQKKEFENFENLHCYDVWRVTQHPAYNQSEKNYLASYLRKQSFNARDIQVILTEGCDTFGTGMSGWGMKFVGARIVNQSYYPGTGYRWQMKVGTSYVYLRGNDTYTGMIVHSWN